MQMTDTKETPAATDSTQPSAGGQASGVIRRYWQLWALFAGLAILVVVTWSLAGTGHNSGTAVSGVIPQARGAVGGQASGIDGHGQRVTHALQSVTTPEEVVASTRLPKKLAAALRAWNAGHGGTALTSVTTYLGEATQAAGVKLFAPMRDACSSLAAEVAVAKLGPVIPDARLEAAYVDALGGLARGATDCKSAISAQANGDEGIQTEEKPSLLHRSEAELAAGGKDLYRVTAKIAAAGKH
jgi:hypothetical protein